MKPETTEDVLEYPDGRLVVVEQFALGEYTPPPSRWLWSYLNSLEFPAQSTHFTTAEVVQGRLQQAGFRNVSTTAVPYQEHIRWEIDWIMLEAWKPQE